MNCGKENIDVMVDAITEDALISLDVAGIEDFENNDLHKRYLEMIGQRYNAQEKCSSALAQISKLEYEIRNDERTHGHKDVWPDLPVAITMAFFATAMNEDDENVRKELFNMMRHIADLMEMQETVGKD